ncbi:hypothetical protein [Rhizobium sp. SSA_523]|uniref:hypothetical protein n=1 Tax=Rhizobium sp. SSA_523 TaxID=2952477 RepID=UPI0020907607|nr:hypothetical protein [Rhizobium sp. SSA_523]MCO5730084.1 hypothetical protein [Rhizobium sp. SSA_523]WKC25149.1 hypothetical protein QTJ18_14270 [Rhizobium sp. SSA_523]
MSLNRTVARLAVVSALNGHLSPVNGKWPTLAGPNIFDSKIEPVEDMAADRAFPCCVVYTDYDKDHWSKGAADKKDRLMTVTLELLIVQVAEVITTGPDGSVVTPTYSLETPATDSEIETSLDLFEVQIFRALNADNEAAGCFNFLCPSYENVISRRGASIEGGTRLAARQITLEMKAPRDNVYGAIPPAIGAFLDKLEEHNDYGGRVDDIRAMFLASKDDTAAEKVAKAYSYPSIVARKLGYETGSQVLLPANLTFHLVTTP